MKEKVLVAMSGGVDSSVTALLLKEEGYEVIGITLQLLPKYIPGNWDGGCCGISNIEDARYVASILDIPHYVLNMRTPFQEKVIDNFLLEYRRGNTPNPCIRCNQFIKFNLLLHKALELGSVFIATGHYARIEYNPEIDKYTLKRGMDLKKDQSYFLYIMNQKQLSHTLMPLGYYTKENVRKIARERGLPVSEKPESQEICFIIGKNYRTFFENFVPDSIIPGPIINKEGKVLGIHKGIVSYTIGQRRGLGIPSKTPLYVTGIVRENHSVIVGKKEEAYHRELLAREINWILEPIEKPTRIKAKIRSIHMPSEATVFPVDGDYVHLIFDNPQWAITPGQACVFYQEDTVIGGGTIEYGN